MQRQSTGESAVGQDRRACRGKAQVRAVWVRIGAHAEAEHR